jgi:hypothetical protein
MAQDLKNIFTLRTPEDAAKISALAQKGQKMIDARQIGGCLGRFHHRKMAGFIKVLTVEAPGRLEFIRGRFSQRETAGPYRLTTAGRVDHPEFVSQVWLRHLPHFHEKKIMKSWSSKMFKFWYVLPPSSPQISFLGWSQLFDIFCNLSGGPRNLASMYPGETPRIGHRKPL